MKGYYYVGLDVHKKVIAYCVKRADGGIVDEGKIRATRGSLSAWVAGLPGRWVSPNSIFGEGAWGVDRECRIPQMDVWSR